MKVKDLIEQLKKADLELPVVVPSDIRDNKFYDVEGLSCFDLQSDEGDKSPVCCLSRYNRKTVLGICGLYWMAAILQLNRRKIWK